MRLMWSRINTGVPGVQDVVQNEDVPAREIRQGVLEKGDAAAAFRAAVVAGHAQAFKPQGKRDAPQQIGGKDQAAIEDRQNRKRLVGVKRGDLSRKRIQARGDGRGGKEDALSGTGMWQLDVQRV